MEENESFEKGKEEGKHGEHNVFITKRNVVFPTI